MILFSVDERMQVEIWNVRVCVCVAQKETEKQPQSQQQWQQIEMNFKKMKIVQLKRDEIFSLD